MSNCNYSSRGCRDSKVLLLLQSLAALFLFSIDCQADSLEQRLEAMDQRLRTLEREVAQQRDTIAAQQQIIASQRTRLETAQHAAPEPESRDASLAERREQLEALVNVDADLAQQSRAPTANPGSDAGVADKLPPVSLSGVVEVEGSYASDYAGQEHSDIVVSTVELAVGARINNWTDSEVIALYEEDDSNLDIDVATISILNPDVTPFYLTAGQFYVPLGRFETAMVSDPLTLELAETRETALQLGFVQGPWQGSVYAFNGDTNRRAGNDQIEQWGASLGAVFQELAGSTAEVSLDYISNIGDSDALQDALADPNDIDDYVPGVALFGSLNRGRWNLLGEYVTATESFAATDLSFRGKGAKPAAWNLELAFEHLLAGHLAVAAIGVQHSSESLALELPRYRYLGSWSLELLNNTALSIEWAHDTDYSVSDGGTGKHGDTLTTQIAVEF